MQSFKGLLISLGLFGVLCWGVASSFELATAAPTRPVPERLQTAVAENGRVRVIVGFEMVSYQLEPQIRSRSAVVQQRQQIAAQQAQLITELEEHTLAVVARYKTMPYLALEVDAAGLEMLANHPAVNYLQEDMLFFPTLGSSTQVIGVENAWNEGYDGEGQAVVVIDTGVDRTHPFFEGRVVDEACFSDPSTESLTFPTMSLCPNGTISQTGVGASDPLTAACLSGNTNLCFHGTHVAGISVGRNDSFQGVAPEADVIGIQVFFRIDDFATCFPQTFTSACVSATFSDILLALEYVYTDLVADHEIAAVNMSLGGERHSDQAACDAALAAIKTAIDQLIAVDVATVIASGNNGWTDSISAPGCVSSAVTVGATDDVDSVTSFSNMHEMVDLLAPGAAIESAVPDGGYSSFDGTSMAAPHVAGAWAVLRQQHPDKGVTEILQLLSNSGRPVADTRAGGTVTRPRIDFAALFGPSAVIAPEVLEVGLTSQTTHTAALTIENIGQDELHWSMLNLVTPTADVSLTAQDEFSLTHSVSQEILASNSMGCATGAQSWFRVFELAEFGMTDPFKVAAVEVGVESSSSFFGIGQFATVNLYTLEGAFGSGDMALVTSAEVVIPDGTQQLVRLPIEGSIPAGSTLVVEIAHPLPVLGGGTVYGSNQAGQTGPSYWQAPNCGANDPVDVATIGHSDLHLVLNVWGAVDVALAACNRPLLENWVEMDVFSGTIAPNDFMTSSLMIDAGGLAAGTYNEWLCMETNDVRKRLVQIPLVLEVSSCAGLPNCILPPEADFALSADEGIAPLTVSFTSLASGVIDGTLWEFGGGQQSTAVDPQHTFDTAGVYAVTMQVSNTIGADTAVRQVTVFAPAAAAFTATMTQTNPALMVAFHNLSVGDYDQCLWDFGDGVQLASCAAVVTHTYQAAGSYEVTLAISGNGGIDIIEQTMLVTVDGITPEVEKPTIYLPLVWR